MTKEPARRAAARLLTVEDLSEQLGISVSTIYRMRSHGDPLPRATKLGPRLVRWRQSDVDAWVEGCLEAQPVVAPSDL